MTHNNPDTSDVRFLIESVCDGTADNTQVRELELRLMNDTEACAFYADLLNLDAELRWIASSEQQGKEAIEKLVAAHTQPATTLIPVLEVRGGVWNGMACWVSSGWPVAYLIATVIFAIGAVIGAFTYVSHPVQVAERLPAVVNGRAVIEQQTEFVGRITGMVDCKWADSSMAPVSGRVSMGQEYSLTSGLMEITYDTGAKVVLQGPVTYEVESQNGGFLSIGKLTAKVEVEKTRYFVVRTPTAIVTDLGTEFGVEVDKHGGTKSHVFRGSVKLEVVSTDGASEVPPCILHANESAQVRKNNDGKGTAIYPVKVDPAVFVRSEQLPQVLAERSLKPFRRWQAYSEELRKDPSLLAYYDFQQAPGSPAVLRNVAANGQSSLDGVIKNATWSDGRMAGKQSLQFNGRDNCVRVNLPQKVDDLTLATWIYVESLDNQFNGLLMSESWTYPPAGQLHWQLTSSGAGGAVMLDVFGWQVPNFKSKPLFDASRFNLFRWKHLALVYDHTATCVRFYLNGQLEEEAKVPKHIPICIGPAFIGYWEVDYASGRDFRNFGGRIDELAIFGRALTYDQVQQIYEAGKL